jgi:hypothetical protein
VRLLGYCLMTNHVHLVAVPDRSDSLRLTLQAHAVPLCPTLQPPLRPQRPPRAGPLLFLSVGP